MYYYDIINLCLFNIGVTAVLRNIRIFCNSDNSVYFVYDDGVCGIEISTLPIDVWHLSMLYRYVDILTGDRMIVGISILVRLATGFDGFMPSHSLAPVMIPQIWVVTTTDVVHSNKTSMETSQRFQMGCRLLRLALTRVLHEPQVPLGPSTH